MRKVRKQREHQRQAARGPEAEQLAVLADDPLGIQTAIHLEGKQPFDSAGIAAYDGLTALQPSEKKKSPTPRRGQRFDTWYGQLQTVAHSGILHDDEQRCLAHFLQVLAHLRPRLIHCYNVAQFSPTNNDMEGCIRAIKTRYRRISGRKNWDASLLRYGRRVAYYEWWTRGRLNAGESLIISCGRWIGTVGGG